MNEKQRSAFLSGAIVTRAADGVSILRHSEVSDLVYFILEGQAVAGIATEGGEYRSLSTMNAGDYFGEIAALTGSPRTADVVATSDITLLQAPAEAMRALMAIPQLSYTFLATMMERLGRTHKTDLPRFAGLDQPTLVDLRTPQVEAEE